MLEWIIQVCQYPARAHQKVQAGCQKVPHVCKVSYDAGLAMAMHMIIRIVFG